MRIKGWQTMGVEVPCHRRIICTPQIEQLDLAIQAIYTIRINRFGCNSRTCLADKNCPLSFGCQRTFWTHDAWSEYNRTTASSSSNRRSNTLTTPSAKLAMKVCELPLSEASAVTGLSEFVSRSYRNIRSQKKSEILAALRTKVWVSVWASQTLITRESPPTRRLPVDCFQSKTSPVPCRSWMTSFRARNELTIWSGPCSSVGS